MYYNFGISSSAFNMCRSPVSPNKPCRYNLRSRQHREELKIMSATEEAESSCNGNEIEANSSFLMSSRFEHDGHEPSPSQSFYKNKFLRYRSLNSLTREQIETLQDSFERYDNPDPLERKRLLEVTGLTWFRIKSWWDRSTEDLIKSQPGARMLLPLKVESPIKRGRGRPRKNPINIPTIADISQVSTMSSFEIKVPTNVKLDYETVTETIIPEFVKISSQDELKDPLAFEQTEMEKEENSMENEESDSLFKYLDLQGPEPIKEEEPEVDATLNKFIEAVNNLYLNFEGLIWVFTFSSQSTIATIIQESLKLQEIWKNKNLFNNKQKYILNKIELQIVNNLLMKYKTDASWLKSIMHFHCNGWIELWHQVFVHSVFEGQTVEQLLNISTWEYQVMKADSESFPQKWQVPSLLATDFYFSA